MAVPTLDEYTIQADVMGTMVNIKADPKDPEKKTGDMPDVGVVASRYTFVLVGNEQVLRLISWDALPRIDKTIAYPWKPNTWYTLKLTSSTKDGKALVRGKVWLRGKEEPKEWTLQVEDPEPNTHGAPALYANATGIIAPAIGSEGFFQNVKVTPNGAAGAPKGEIKKPEPTRNTKLDSDLFGPAASEASVAGWNDRSPRVPCRCNRCRLIR
jgi:hypothetical protein